MTGDPFLHRLALFAERHYRGVFVAAGLLVLLSGVLALRIRFDPDVLNLLPDDDPVVAAFRDALNEFGGLNLLLVAVRVPEGAVIDPYHEVVDRLGPELEALPEIDYVDYRLPEPLDLVRDVFPDAVYFLDETGRQGVEARLSEAGIEQRVAEIRRQLMTPQALVRKQLFLLDPMGLSELVLAQLTGGRGNLGVEWSSGYYQSKDRRLILLLAKPTRPAQDIDFNRLLVPRVEATVERVVEEWRREQTAAGETPPAPEVVLGGGYVTAVDDTALIRRDVIRQAVGSLAIVLALFLFAFRRLGLLLYALIPLGTGMIVTFGFAGAAVGTLSSATSGFAALLIGLGIDFVIVSYGRYVEERHRGADESTSILRMTGSCGRAVVVGGVTSAATFYAFGVTEFTGLRQMGILTGTGILFCMVSVLLLLPAMLAWSHDRKRRSRSEVNLYVHGFGAGWLLRRSVARPALTLAVGGAITLVATILLTQLTFEEGIRNMRSASNRGVQVENEVSSHFGSNFEYMMLVLRGDDLGEVLAASDRAATRFRELVDGEVLSGVESISDLLPPPAQQQAVLDWLERGRQDWLDVERIRGTFAREVTEEGLRTEPFAEGLTLLDEALSPTAPMSLADLEANPHAGRLVERYLRRTAEGDWKSVLYLYTPPEIWKRRPPPQVEAVAAELGPDAVLTGVNVVSRNLRQQVWKDAVVAAIVGTLAVAFLLWLDYRRLRETLLSLLPLTIGIVWMLGSMVVLGISMNFMNIFVTTMVIGIGVDYGVHILHRYRELVATDDEAGAVATAADRAGLVEGLAETGRAIGMAAVTTMVGFGSLVVSSYPGLRSIGYLAILGALFTSGVAITLLPAYLVLRYRR